MSPSSSPVQDTGLSRRRRRFKSGWGRYFKMKRGAFGVPRFFFHCRSQSPLLPLCRHVHRLLNIASEVLNVDFLFLITDIGRLSMIEKLRSAFLAFTNSATYRLFPRQNESKLKPILNRQQLLTLVEGLEGFSEFMNLERSVQANLSLRTEF